MGAVSYRLRAEFRTRWKSALALALVAGIAGAITVAAVAGARRTSTAFDRFRTATNASDILVNPDLGSNSKLRSADIQNLPGVLDAGRVNGLAFLDPTTTNLADAFVTSLASDGHVLYELARVKLLAGRLPDSRDPDEIVVNRAFTKRYGLGIGDTWRVLGATNNTPTDQPLTPAILREIRRRQLRHQLGNQFLDLELRVVGIGVDQNEIVVDQGFDNPGAFLGPAFRRTHPDTVVQYWGEVVRLRPGTDPARFQHQVEALVPDEAIAFQTIANTRAKVDRAVRPQSGALVAFAIVVGFTGLLVIAQTLARQTSLDGVDHGALRAIGATRRQLFLLAMGRTLPAAFLAAVITMLGAFALSPLTPIGVARVAEPDPGLAFDATTLALGALALLVVILLIEAIPAWRTSRAASDTAPTSRPSRISGALAATGTPPVVATGVRMALEPGAGRTAVPVRTTIASVLMTIAAVTGAVVVATSLNHLVDTPSLYGWNWNAAVRVGGQNQAAAATNQDQVQRRIAENSEVRYTSTLSISAIEINGRQIPTAGLDTRHARPTPAVPDGRPPRTEHEIALGARTQRSLGVVIGDHVTVRDQQGRARSMTVVGRVVLPGLGTYPGADKTSPGEGALVTQPALSRLGPDFGRHELLVEFRAGTSVNRQRAVLRTAGKGVSADGYQVALGQQPSDVVAYKDMRSTPIVLSIVLALLATMTLAHGLVSSVRRRRRELALLKTLGFTRRQVSSTVAWHASTVVAIALLFGIPLGIVAGRWAWNTLATDLGAVVVPVVPWLVLAIGIPALLLLANLVAFIPGRIAARLRPAAALRGE